MKQIVKSDTEPQALVNYRIDSNGLNYTWDCFQGKYKNDYKTYLLKEQGHICAYCMQRISIAEMKIEHLKPRHNCKTEVEKLSDHNMVAVCKGITDAEHHCDTRRGNLKRNLQALSILPTQSNPSCEDLTHFVSGNFKAKDENATIEDDINIKLNLNCNALKTARNATEQGFIDGLITKAFDNGFEWTVDLLTSELNNILQIGVSFEQRRFNEFCLIEAKILRQKIDVRTA